LGIGPNPQSPIPNPQSPSPLDFLIEFYNKNKQINSNDSNNININEKY